MFCQKTMQYLVNNRLVTQPWRKYCSKVVSFFSISQYEQGNFWAKEMTAFYKEGMQILNVSEILQLWDYQVLLIYRSYNIIYTGWLNNWRIHKLQGQSSRCLGWQLKSTLELLQKWNIKSENISAFAVFSSSGLPVSEISLQAVMSLLSHTFI